MTTIDLMVSTNRIIMVNVSIDLACLIANTLWLKQRRILGELLRPNQGQERCTDVRQGRLVSLEMNQIHPANS